MENTFKRKVEGLVSISDKTLKGYVDSRGVLEVPGPAH